MGKLDVSMLRYLDRDAFRVLTAVEMGMKNHELVPKELVLSIASLRSGGSSKLLVDLCKHRLLVYENSGNRYQGYRLTNTGYDYLALKSLVARNVISAFGNQIGTGKESNIYVVSHHHDESGDEEMRLCLKLHRLGRICFRKLREKRDYHKARRQMSWLYLSRISATKEFAYLKALHERGFPVPKPYDFNRHCVVMELVDGYPLQRVTEVPDPAALYERLVKLLIRFANHGVIHGDYNEFNILLDRHTGEPVIIDFPQMVSTMHPDAASLFERDLRSLRHFFKRRFDFESAEAPPTFEVDVWRVDALDAEIRASGITRRMEKDLLQELEAIRTGDGFCDGSSSSEVNSDLESSSPFSKEQSCAGILERSEHESTTNLKINLARQLEETRLDKGAGDVCGVDVRHEEYSCSGEEPSGVQCEGIGCRTIVAASTTASTIAPDVIRARVKASIKKKRAHELRSARTKQKSNGVSKLKRENEVMLNKEAFWLFD